MRYKKCCDEQRIGVSPTSPSMKRVADATRCTLATLLLVLLVGCTGGSRAKLPTGPSSSSELLHPWFADSGNGLRWGLIRHDGTVHTPPVYTAIAGIPAKREEDTLTSMRYAVVAKGNWYSILQWQIVTADKSTVALPKAMYYCSPVREGTLWGRALESIYSFDLKGNTVGVAPYQTITGELGAPSNGIRTARGKNKLWGIVDERLEWIVKPRWERVGRYFSEEKIFFQPTQRKNHDSMTGLGDARDYLQHSQYGFLSRETLSPCIAPQFDSAKSFAEGLAPVEICVKTPAKNDDQFGAEDWVWGYVDHDGNFAIKLQFRGAQPFSDGYAVVKLDGETLFINRRGEVQTWGRFEQARGFREGKAAVKRNGKWGFIDTSGTVRIECRYDHVWDFSGGLALTNRGADQIWTRDSSFRKGGLWTYLNHRGEPVFKWQTPRPEDP